MLLPWPESRKTISNRRFGHRRDEAQFEKMLGQTQVEHEAVKRDLSPGSATDQHAKEEEIRAWHAHKHLRSEFQQLACRWGGRQGELVRRLQN